MKHLTYLKYVFQHKYHVFRAGRYLKVPIWQLLIHDLSKFLPSEYFPYVEFFYGEKDQEAFNRAWNHHQKRNKHHYQYWLLYNDNGSQYPLEMPEKYVREMVADWYGAGFTKLGKNEVADWWQKTRASKKLHANTVKRVEELVQIISTL